MKPIIINTELLKKFDLTLSQFFVLYALIDVLDTVALNTTIEELHKKGLIKPFTNNELFNDTSIFVPTEESKTLISSFLYEAKIVSNSDDLEQLATTLKELFPEGKKTDGHPWRSNTKEVIEKLKRFKLLYNYNNDQIIEATQRYTEEMINSPYMRTLKHFIIKKVDGENVSDLASYIENDSVDTTMSKFKTIYRDDKQ